MQLLARLILFTALCWPLVAQEAADGPWKVRREAWSFDRSEMNWYDWAEPEQHQKDGVLRNFAGWTEYDVEIPAAGWYSLWIEGQPITWPLDIFIDGELSRRDSTGTRLDYEQPEAPNDRARGAMKKGSFFLTGGKHAIRLQRLGFPGHLPSAWELRASGDDPAGCLRAELDSPRVIAAAAAPVVLSIHGGAGQATRYEVVARAGVGGTESTVARVEFPVSDKPVVKRVEFALPGPGAWFLLPKAGDAPARPADLIGGVVVVSPVIAETAPDREAIVPDQLEVAAFFYDGAILQQGKPMPVWGWAPPGETVSVSLAGQHAETRADDRGRWRVTFEPLAPGGPHELTVTAGKARHTAKDIHVGEVWLMSGQSNMGGGLGGSTGGKELAEAADDPLLRTSTVFENPAADSPNRLRRGWWSPAAPHPQQGTKFLLRWNAISYAFGSSLREALDLPVGILINNRGGTIISAWTSIEVQQRTPAFAPEMEALRIDREEHALELRVSNSIHSVIEHWQRQVERPKEGQDPPPAPDLDKEVAKALAKEHRNDPARLFEALLAPLPPFPIRGVCWYQGESDSRRAWRYRQMLPAMIVDWRARWENPELPFMIVQLAPGAGDPPKGAPGDSAGAELREAQTLVADKDPHAALIVAHDLPVPGDDVHYHDKVPVGRRLARAALATVYGKDVVGSGPRYERMKIEGDRIRLFFRHAEGGLAARGGELKGFQIAAEPGQWHWAQARIDGDSVVVWHPEVKAPKAVRYAWNDKQPGSNLYNAAGLPAPTFRTDDWELTTTDN